MDGPTVQLRRSNRKRKSTEKAAASDKDSGPAASKKKLNLDQEEEGDVSEGSESDFSDSEDSYDSDAASESDDESQTQQMGAALNPAADAAQQQPARVDSDSDVCSVCLDPPVHPVHLDCGHRFCFMCAKGLYAGGNQSCSLCRAPIPVGFFQRPNLLQRSRSDLAGATVGVNNWQWFYEARSGGWWKFEERTNREIEEAFNRDELEFDTLICGSLYTIDLVNLCQYKKDDQMRTRKIKRDAVIAQCKGVAGLVLKPGQ